MNTKPDQPHYLRSAARLALIRRVADGIALPVGAFSRLAEVQEPGGACWEAGGAGGLGTMSCNGGRLCFKVCSASKASLVHVRAMSFRMACTRYLKSLPPASHIQRRE